MPCLQFYMGYCRFRSTCCFINVEPYCPHINQCTLMNIDVFNLISLSSSWAERIVHNAYTSGKQTPGGGTMTPFHSLCLKHQHFYCEVRGQTATGCVVLRFLRAFIGLCAAVQAKHGGCTSSGDRWANSRNIAVRTCAVRLLSAPDDRRLQPSAEGQRWDIQGEINSKNQGEPFRPYRSVTQAARVTLQRKVDSQ